MNRQAAKEVANKQREKILERMKKSSVPTVLAIIESKARQGLFSAKLYDNLDFQITEELLEELASLGYTVTPNASLFGGSITVSWD